MFQELIGGASEEIERRVDGAAERFYGQIEPRVSAATGSLDQANRTFQDVITGTAGSVVEPDRHRDARDHRLGRTTVNEAFNRFENSATSFQSLIAGSADDLEQKVDGAAERLYVRIAETAEQVTGQHRRRQRAASAPASSETSDGATARDRAPWRRADVNELMASTSSTIAGHLQRHGRDRQSRDGGVGTLALAERIVVPGGQVTDKLIDRLRQLHPQPGAGPRGPADSMITTSSEDVTQAASRTRRCSSTASSTAPRAPPAGPAEPWSRRRPGSTPGSTRSRPTCRAANWSRPAQRITDYISTSAGDAVTKVASGTDRLTSQLDGSSTQQAGPAHRPHVGAARQPARPGGRRHVGAVR